MTRMTILPTIAAMDVIMSAMQGKDMADAMEYDGVLPETLVFLVES